MKNYWDHWTHALHYRTDSAIHAQRMRNLVDKELRMFFLSFRRTLYARFFGAGDVIAGGAYRWVHTGLHHFAALFGFGALLSAVALLVLSNAKAWSYCPLLMTSLSLFVHVCFRGWLSRDADCIPRQTLRAVWRCWGKQTHLHWHFPAICTLSWLTVAWVYYLVQLDWQLWVKGFLSC